MVIMEEVNKCEMILSEELNILVVGIHQDMLETIQKELLNLVDTEKSHKTYLLRVDLALSTADIPEPKHTQYDFVVFLLPANRLDIFEITAGNIRNLGSTYHRQKVCIVPVDCDYDTVLQPNVLWEFRKAYQCSLIHASFQTQEKIRNLGRGILNLAEAACGLINGVPFVGNV